MSDIKINKSFSYVSSSCSRDLYGHLKNNYEKLVKQMQKTDFANSIVFIEKELTLLQELKDIAQKENLESELVWIKQQEREIKSALRSQESSLPSGVYYKPISFGSDYNPAETLDMKVEKDIYSEYKDYVGEEISLDEDVVRDFLSGFVLSRDNLYCIDYLMKKCINNEGQLDSKKVDVVKILSSFGVSASNIMEAMELLEQKKSNDSLYMTEESILASLSGKSFDISESTKKTVNDDFSINEEILSNICFFKTFGFTDTEAIKTAKFLNQDFENKEEVKSYIKELSKIGVSNDTTLSILNVLKVRSPETNKYDIKKTAVDSLISVKRNLIATRKNEQKEAQNPINLLGVSKHVFEDILVIEKNGVVTYRGTASKKNVDQIKKDYEKSILTAEDRFLENFAKAYKDKNGEINSPKVRALVNLRKNGISYEELIKLIDFSSNADGTVNSSTLKNIAELKKSGALSREIIPLLKACGKNDDGSYDMTDISIIKDLTKAVIDGKNVISFLPEVHKCGELLYYLTYYSQFFEDKSKLNSMLDLVRDQVGNYDVNAIDIVYSLSNMMLAQKNKTSLISDLKSASLDIIDVAKNNSDKKVGRDATEAISVLTKYNFAVNDMVEILSKCKDENGDFSQDLTDIVWDFCTQNSDVAQINKILDICRNSDGTINEQRAKGIVAVLDINMPVEQIFAMIVG